MGYGFDVRTGAYAAAALDVLSGFQPGGDASYQRWPLKYPAAGQVNVPAEAYPITLSWQYFGPSPSLGSAAITTTAGGIVPSTATTDIIAGHKGMLITPTVAFPAATRITVSVAGSYSGVPFSHTWSFTDPLALGSIKPPGPLKDLLPSPESGRRSWREGSGLLAWHGEHVPRSWHRTLEPSEIFARFRILAC